MIMRHIQRFIFQKDSITITFNLHNRAVTVFYFMAQLSKDSAISEIDLTFCLLDFRKKIRTLGYVAIELKRARQ